MKKTFTKSMMAVAMMLGVTGIASAQNQDQQQQDQGQYQQGQMQGGRGGRRQQQQFDTGGDFGGGGGGGRRSRQIQYNNYGTGTRTLTGDGYNDQYGAIFEHNIFLRDRRPVPVRQNTMRPLTAEESYVLTGIVLEENEYRAYAENVSQPSMPTLKLRVNDPIARGKVAEVTIDQLAYEHDGEKTWVTVGSNLTGSQVADMSAARSSARMGVSDSGFTGYNNGGLNIVGNGRNNGGFNNNNGFNGGFAGGGNNFNNNNNGNFGNLNGGGRGRRGGGGIITPATPPPPLPAGDAANLSIEERMRLRRLGESLPTAAIPQGAAESLAPTPEPEAPAAQPEAPIVPNAAGLSVEEQMRLRRAQQVGQ